MQAARHDALVGLLDLMTTKPPASGNADADKAAASAMATAAKRAVAALLTPTPPTMAETAAVAYAAANAPVVSLPPQVCGNVVFFVCLFVRVCVYVGKGGEGAGGARQ